MFLEYIITEIGLAAAKSKIKDASIEAAAREKLTQYLETQHKLNFNCTQEEEIDFESLSNYIRNELIEDVRVRLFDPDTDARRNAHKTIISKARSYAQSKTKMSERRAVKMVNTAIIILRRYYIKNANRDLTLLANYINDEVTDAINKSNDQFSQQLKQICKEMTKDDPLSLKHNLNLAREGNFYEVGRNISTCMETLNSEHPLKPYYGFNLERNGDAYTLVSIPLCEEAKRRYPPQIYCSGTPTRIGDKDVSQLTNCDIFGYAYRHQLPITINVSAAKKLLGNILDPIQAEAKEIEKKSLVLVPPRFPKAFPCSIKIDDKIEFDYLLMRIKEISEDGTLFLTNEEQDHRSFDISFSMNNKTNKANFCISVLPTSANVERLKYLNFMKDASNGKQLVIKSLSLNCCLGSGTLAHFVPPETLDDEIQLLKKLVEIERYFKNSFILPKEILRSDYEVIDYIFTLIHTGSFSGHWTSCKTKFEVDDEFKKTVENLEDIPYSYQYICTADVELFEKNFSFGVKRELHSVRFENLQHIKRKVKESDIGDIITINYIPDSKLDNTFTDCFLKK